MSLLRRKQKEMLQVAEPSDYSVPVALAVLATRMDQIDRDMKGLKMLMYLIIAILAGTKGLDYSGLSKIITGN